MNGLSFSGVIQVLPEGLLMRCRNSLLIPLFLLPTIVLAEVVELESEELLNAYVPGISIEQVVTDAPFATDDEKIRESVAEQINLVGVVPPAIAVANADVLHREKSLDSLLAGVTDTGTRDLVEDAITETALGPRLELNLQRIAAETGIEPGATTRDFDSMRGALLELMPITTGYQFEFNNRY